MKLTFENVGKRYGTFRAVKNFNAELSQGVYGLVGPNGAGKTTLLRMAVEVLSPTRGRILYGGKDIKVLDEDYREILGYLPQQFGLYRHFTAEKFLQYMGALKGLDPKLVDKKTQEVLELVNLKGSNRKKLGTFSGGMKQRPGIAQALLNDPLVPFFVGGAV